VNVKELKVKDEGTGDYQLASVIIHIGPRGDHRDFMACSKIEEQLWKFSDCNPVKWKTKSSLRIPQLTRSLIKPRHCWCIQNQNWINDKANSRVLARDDNGKWSLGNSPDLNNHPGVALHGMLCLVKSQVRCPALICHENPFIFHYRLTFALTVILCLILREFIFYPTNQMGILSCECESGSRPA
jgi:hypothetical protein